MKKVLLSLSFLSLAAVATAQQKTPANTQPTPRAAKTTAEQSEPKARIELEKVKKAYDAMNGFQADFVMQTELGDERGKDRKGKVIIKGNKYRVETPDFEMVSDGKKRWTYLKKGKEVQVSNANEPNEMGLASPAELLNIYTKPDFIYKMHSENVEAGKEVEKIEFKPIKGFSDYSKIRVTIDKQTHQMTNLKVFEKSGARYTLKLSNVVKSNAADTEFVFDKSKHPGVKEVNLD
jgi:outer membrane lipoprotein carrier protein